MNQSKTNYLKKIAYVVVNEDLCNPLLQSQVIDVLSAINSDYNHSIFLFLFYRVDYLFRGSVKIKNLKKELDKKGIKLHTFPFVSIPRVSIYAWWQFLFVLPQILAGLLIALSSYKINLLHCRSYFASFVAWVSSYIFSVQFIFDPRSPFPEENVTGGKWTYSSLNYKLWKYFEKQFCRKSYATIVTSHPFAEKFLKDVPETKIEIIPNNYPASFKRNEKNFARKPLFDNPHKITLCYVGSLGHWNDATTYVKFLSKFNEVFFDFNMKFIVPEKYVIFLENALNIFEIPREKIIIKSVDQKNVIDELLLCDLGVQLMKYPDDRLGVKFVEYMAAGLPVLVSENVQGAADVVIKNKVGFVVKNDFSNLQNAASFVEGVKENKIFWYEKCKKLAECEFSPSAVAYKTYKMYQESVA